MMFKHTLIYFLSKGVPGIINFVAIALYTRLLSPEEYGEYALVIAAVTFVNTTLFHWLRLGLLRYNPKFEGNQKTMFISSVTATFISMSILTIFLGTGAFVVYTPAHSLALLWFLGIGLLTMQSIFDLFTEYLRSELASKLFGVVTSLKVVLSLVFSYLLIRFFDFGGEGIVLGLILGIFFSIVFFIPRYSYLINIKMIDKEMIREVVIYSVPFIAALSMEAIILNTDRYLIGWMMDTKAVGIYAVSYDLAKQILFLLMMIINLAAYPLVVKALETGGIKECQKQLNQNTTLLLMVSFPATAGMILLSSSFTDIFLGEQFQGKAAIIFSLIAFAIFIQGFKMYYFDLAFQLGKNTKLQIWPVLAAAVLNVLLNLLLIPKYGIFGSAYATIISYILSVLLSAWIGKRIFPLTFPIKEVGKIIIATGIMGITIWPALSLNGISGFIAQIIIGMIVYTIVILILNVSNFRNLFFKRLRKTSH
ncbi:oligosaccharide flippase family protein [Rossellomorea aquimaris]|uniref:oligosaccharide flippase family protein n=1 Tax=Rossellomorea aquimaris TaxID=189382 RepID=UPI001CD7AC17|nr:oligosaccharide flippase family protein [Rossellomorea aquimaris]MCA1060806.1 oligosaccharide flippase family protein [Rossellomorea aquimaris]